MTKLSDAQNVIYQFILSEQKKNGFPPTVREICEGVGLHSPSSVHRYLRILTEQGYLVGDPNKKRAYAVAEPSVPDAEIVPLLGKVAAGVPITSYENREDAFAIPSLLLHRSHGDSAFMLRVDGESMRDAGIRDRDIIVVEQGLTPVDGSIVVARVDGEDVTVKRIFQTGSIVELRPENDAFQPMFFPSDRVEILGCVTGLMRSY
ncbi:MAG: transcriptional repressor LexA [Clostridia bacterium]|nr:transcriptional repressor LexA [Clostridia bacterium]MBR3129406.1 transcriptional repressor LexA [Clostridia bacterium]